MHSFLRNVDAKVTEGLLMDGTEAWSPFPAKLCRIGRKRLSSQLALRPLAIDGACGCSKRRDMKIWCGTTAYTGERPIASYGLLSRAGW